jgi:hypothetical protein
VEVEEAERLLPVLLILHLLLALPSHILSVQVERLEPQEQEPEAAQVVLAAHRRLAVMC